MIEPNDKPVPGTKLPWKFVNRNDEQLLITGKDSEGFDGIIAATKDVHPEDLMDWPYIVHACNSYPDLTEEVSRLRELLEDCKQTCHERCRTFNDGNQKWCDCGAVEINARIAAALSPERKGQ